jgi:glycosyltransferase involved in cell wall biosynthesis
MIVKNEEEVLARCMESVKGLVDEIIIVDTGSTDKTKEIALKYTDKVYDFEWIQDFAAARNFAFEKATKDYTMWLDADDVILEEDAKKFLELKETIADDVDMAMFKYNVGFDDQGNTTYSYYRERIFRTSNHYPWIGKIHEVIVPQGNLINLDIAITHKPHGGKDPQRNLKIFEKMIADGDKLCARELFYYARELYYNERYEEAVERFEEFLDDEGGWVEDKISASRDLAIVYYRLGQDENAVHSLYRSFEFDEPRAEVCCDIGKHFFDREKFKIAAFWYNVALSKNIEDFPQGFRVNDTYDFLPNIQLSVCYDRMGDYEKAYEHHLNSQKVKPENAAVIYNEKYFNGLIERKVIKRRK